MKLIKNIVLSIVLAISFTSLSVPLLVSAATDPVEKICEQGGASASPVCANRSVNDPFTRSTGSDGIINRATMLVAIVTGIIAVIMVILGAYTYITSSGEPAKLKGAKDTIVYALIGLAVAAFAPFIVQFVLDKI